MKSKIFCSMIALVLVFSACDKDRIQQEEDEDGANAVVRLGSQIEGEYTVYSDGLAKVIIEGDEKYITRFKLIDDYANTLYAYCADINAPCYEGSRYKSVPGDDYFTKGEDVKIMAAITYAMNEYGALEATNPYGYRQLLQCVIWRIIHDYEVTSVDNAEGEIIKDIIDHIYDHIDDMKNDYSTGITMEGTGAATRAGTFVNYGPYQVSENALLTDAGFDLTFDPDGNQAAFVDGQGLEIMQVKSGEPFYVQVPNDASGEYSFTATASTTKKLWYVNDFQFFIDVRDSNVPYMYQPLFRPITNSGEWTSFYTCSGNFTATPMEPEEPEKIMLTCLIWNNRDCGGSRGIDRFTVDGITLKDSKNYVTPADFNARTAKTPGKKGITAIYTVTERTVKDACGKRIKVYDIKVAFYKDGVWKGYGGTITVDGPGGNNKNQQVELIRIF
ncbi:MAG: hypothetical protein LBL24_03890 [Bacteroidales bacterium]|nr:hypothetical protein [Bacteroidales bacterium]